MARKPKKQTKRTRKPAWRETFLAALAVSGSILKACELANVCRANVYTTRDKDEAFAAAMALALDQAVDVLEIEARRRAVEGLIRKEFHKGEPLIDPSTGEQYFEREYSDSLLQLLLRAHRPEKYRERHQVEHTGGVKLEIVEE